MDFALTQENVVPTLSLYHLVIKGEFETSFLQKLKFFFKNWSTAF